MIQRIQSIFYLLVSGAFFAQFAVPFATSEQPMENYFSDSIYNIQDHVAMIVLTVLGGILALINIFLFKNRPLQIRLGYMIISLGILLPIVAALLMLNDGNPVAEGVSIDDKLGLYLPILVVVFGFLANKYVKKDNNLVKSMDRLR